MKKEESLLSKYMSKKRVYLPEFVADLAKEYKLYYIRDYEYTIYGWPDSQNTMDDAFEKITMPIALWWSSPTDCLVVLNLNGQKVGIKRSELTADTFDDFEARFEKLIDGIGNIESSYTVQ